MDAETTAGRPDGADDSMVACVTRSPTIIPPKSRGWCYPTTTRLALAALLIWLQSASCHAIAVETPPSTKHAALLGISQDLSLAVARPTGELVEYPYRLFLPRPLISGKQYPLLLWLHGGGFEPGSDNVSHLAYIDSQIYDRGPDGEYPFFLLAPQCPDSCPWYASLQPLGDGNLHTARPRDMLDIVSRIVSRTIDEQAVDENRVSVVGISSGADAALEACRREPWRFAAAAPIAGSFRNFRAVKPLLGRPVWAFHSVEDETPIEGARLLRDYVEQAGGDFYLSEVPGDSHNCWFNAFGDYDLLDWLLSQRLDHPVEAPPYWRLGDLVTKWLNEKTLYSLPLPTALLAVFFWSRLSSRQKSVPQ